MYIIVIKIKQIKMDKNKLIENIKAQLKSLMTSEVKFAEIKAGDLMITSQDEVLVVGSEVFTIDQDGNNIPLTDGDYTLDSGEVITVVSGKIEGIVTTTPEEVTAEEEVDEEVEVDETETPEEAEEPIQDEEEEMGKNKMAKMEERLAKCEKMLEEMGKEKAAMEQKLSKISNEPSSASISVEPAEFKSVENKKESIGSFDITELRAKIRSNR
jgi:hypothetical protein